MKDLAGKNVAEVQLTSLNSLAVEILAKKAGIDPASIHQVAIPFPQMPRPSPRAGCRRRSSSRRYADGAREGATVLTHPNVACSRTAP